MQKRSKFSLLLNVDSFLYSYQSDLRHICSLFQDSYPCRTLKAPVNVIGDTIQIKNREFLTAQGGLCVMTVQRLLCVLGQTCLTAPRYAISIISRRSAVFIHRCISPSSSFIIHSTDGFFNQIAYSGSRRCILTRINHFVRVDKSPQTPLHTTAFLTCQHTSTVVSSAIHHTKLSILTGSIDKTAKLWRMSADGRQVDSVVSLVGHSGPVYSVVFHPTDPLIATGSGDGTAKLWRMSDDGTEVTCIATLEGHKGRVNSVAFHPHFPIIATSCISNGTVKLWSLQHTPSETKIDCVATLNAHKPDEFTRCSIAFHPSAPFMVTSVESEDTAKVWSLSSSGTEATCIAILDGHKLGVTCSAFHPSELLIATASSSTVRLWLLLDGKVTCVATLMGEKSRTILSIAFRKKSIETTDTGGNIQSF
jgi:WD40 repeat protein